MFSRLAKLRHKLFDDGRIRRALKLAVGPAPWYWESFPCLDGPGGTQLRWRLTGAEGEYPRHIALTPEGQSEDLRFIAGIYTRAFLVAPGLLGIWHPSDPLIRLAAFDPSDLDTFSPSDIPDGFFEDRLPYFCRATPLAEFSISSHMDEGEHRIDLPLAFASIERTLIITNYAEVQEPACAAIMEICPGRAPGSHRLCVLPQKWFSRDRFDLGYQWITRVIRDPKTNRICGDGIRIGAFELTEDGCHLERWL